MKHPQHQTNLARVRDLKATASPATGQPHTYAEIGAVMGTTAMGAHYYAKGLRGVCPGCLRKLRKAQEKIA